MPSKTLRARSARVVESDTLNQPPRTVGVVDRRALPVEPRGEDDPVAAGRRAAASALAAPARRRAVARRRACRPGRRPPSPAASRRPCRRRPGSLRPSNARARRTGSEATLCRTSVRLYGTWQLSHAEVPTYRWASKFSVGAGAHGGRRRCRRCRRRRAPRRAARGRRRRAGSTVPTTLRGGHEFGQAREVRHRVEAHLDRCTSDRGVAERLRDGECRHDGPGDGIAAQPAPLVP